MKKVRNNKGFSLIELLVVIVIMAILSTVALQSVEGTLDQSRETATVTTLKDIEKSVLGDFDLRQPNGTPFISGFVADVGRLPMAVGSDPETQFQELWIRPSGTNFLSLVPSINDGDVKIFSGWRRSGYLRLPLGETELRDAYKESFDLENSGYTTALVTDKIYKFSSSKLSSDFAIDMTNRFEGSVEIMVSGVVSTELTGDSGPDVIRIVLYEPDELGGIDEITSTDIIASPFRYVFNNVTVGSRIFRVYQGVAAELDTDITNTTKISEVTQVVVTPGGLTVTLQIQ